MTRLSHPKSGIGGYRLSRRTRTRFEGMGELGVMAVRKISAIDTIMTAKEVAYSSYKVVVGKHPPSIGRILVRTPSRLAAGARRPHPYNCQCPFHGGHPGWKVPAIRGIGRGLRLPKRFH